MAVEKVLTFVAARQQRDQKQRQCLPHCHRVGSLSLCRVQLAVLSRSPDPDTAYGVLNANEDDDVLRQCVCQYCTWARTN